MAQRHLRRVQTCVRQLERARVNLRDAIMAAHRSGESTRDIAPWAGLSHSKVYELLKEAEEEERRRTTQTGQ